MKEDEILEQLQRGRAHVSAEIQLSGSDTANVTLLQRGRAHVSAEIHRTGLSRVFALEGFNGAALT